MFSLKASRSLALIAAAVTLGGVIGFAQAHSSATAEREHPTTVTGYISELLPVQAASAHFADFATEIPSLDVRHVADWVADSHDAAGSYFVVIDKKYARMFVFDGDARLRGATPVLLGSARGDDTVPGIGSRPLAEVQPEERTTPAGRFVAERGENMRGEDNVWVDYDAGVSIHRVLATNPKERRLERLATPAVDDNRISYGCVNVPTVFYETHIRPIFAISHAVVYVLPDVKPVQQVFGSYNVAAAHGLVSAGSTVAIGVLPQSAAMKFSREAGSHSIREHGQRIAHKQGTDLPGSR